MTLANFSGKKPTIHRVLLVLVAGIAFFTGCSQPSAKKSESDSSNNEIQNTPIPVSQTSPRTSNFVVEAVEKVGPAVVRIDSSRNIKTDITEGYGDPFSRRFFGAPPPSQRVQRGTGSGFLINAEGQVLTNAHVIDGADTVKVTLSDGRSFSGKVLGEDKVTDIAVVKINANNLPTVAIGNSERLQPGEWAIAIGNPLGLDKTVTVGVISATERSSSQVGVPDKRIGFIQTDAAINPGNSGGPLLNSRGEVVGINTAIIGGAQGLGFAIPINRAQQIAQQLISKGKVEHPFIGVQMVDLTPEVKERLKAASDGKINITANRGVLVIRTVRNSPAASAGIKPGDIIQKVGDRTVTKSDQVQEEIEKYKVGDRLPIQLQRDNQTQNLQVQLGTLPTATTMDEEP
ncbi:trypsin-like peptidase domain-containing protein [Phormidium sp. LEGE 05292]|uniref:HhoA/HhoB/HtrA family serine endopeptidase n=1 Tax=[Phormidium] sp. LEGE 05292 TaxID=767427 RepID=UPI0018803426|nr:HhoA/HhoB/HtrA family serine endopeptidase [Phormidium sp. LEGE 05292]MBE9226826.1 trypsin-like peptidase domain-containing protein [Phormidium sp. LEGE 05292]